MVTIQQRFIQFSSRIYCKVDGSEGKDWDARFTSSGVAVIGILSRIGSYNHI